MEYIIKQTIEVMTRIEADSEEHALKLLDNLCIDDTEQITILDTQIESITDYELSLTREEI
jgi:hypothetical protein